MRFVAGKTRKRLLRCFVLATLKLAQGLIEPCGGRAALADLVKVERERERGDHDHRCQPEQNLGHVELEEEPGGFKDTLKLVGLLELFAAYLVAGRQLSLRTRP